MAAMPPPEARDEEEGRGHLSRAWPKIPPVTLDTAHWAEPSHVACFSGEPRNVASICAAMFLVYRRWPVSTAVTTPILKFIRKPSK